MGLYWVRPYQYLSLDSRNRNFLTKFHNVSDNTRLLVSNNTKNIPTAENYLEICKHWNDKLQSGKYEYNDFPSFSYYVWISEKTNLEKIEENNDNSFSISENKHYWLYAPGENAFLWDEFYNEVQLRKVNRKFEIFLKNFSKEKRHSETDLCQKAKAQKAYR